MMRSIFACSILLSAGVAYADDPPPSDTKTEGDTAFPEDSGKLPPSNMPEGGARKEGVTPEASAEDKKDCPDCEPLPLVLDWEGYVRLVGDLVEDDALPFIGRNDGFQMANARLGLSARYGESWQAYISIDGALQQSQGANDVNAQLSVGLRDAYLEYSWKTWLSARAGRFKMPYDIADLEDIGERTFIELSLESRGVEPTKGIEVEGLAPGRQLGVMLHRPRMKITEKGFDVGYAVALTNGKTGDLYFNDNDAFAGFARLTLHWGEWVSLHGAAFLDTRTVGELPNLFDEDVMGVEGSLEIKLGDLRLEGQFLMQNTQFTTSGIEDVTALGFHAQWAYRLWGFEVGYRFAYYDPNDRFDADLVSEHTVVLSYFFHSVPVRLSLSGTLADEERDVDNNRFTALAQYKF